MTQNFKKTWLRGDFHIHQARIVFWISRKEVRIDQIIKKQEILIYNVGEQ